MIRAGGTGNWDKPHPPEGHRFDKKGYIRLGEEIEELVEIEPDWDYLLDELQEQPPIEQKLDRQLFGSAQAPIPKEEQGDHVGLVAMGQSHIGGCKLIGKTDDDMDGWGLLWDQCKECPF